MVPTAALQAALFFSPQFYCYPWKPLLNSLIGDSYDIALKHFLVNHMTAPNLALHGVCMVVQLVGNFCFLATLDDAYLPGAYRPVSLLTAAVWIAYMLFFSAGVPLWCQIASSLSIGAAFWTAPALIPYEETISHVLLAAFLVVLVVVIAVYRSQLNIRASVLSSLVLVGVHVLWNELGKSEYKQALDAKNLLHINVAFVVITLLLSFVKNPLVPTVAFGYLVGKTLAVVTGQPWLFYFSFGFFGSVLQAVSHLVTREIPTLVALQSETPEDKVRYEFAHVTYFPNLVFDGVHQYMLAASNARAKSE